MPLKQCDRYYINPILLSDLEKTSSLSHCPFNSAEKSMELFSSTTFKKISVNYDTNNSIDTNPYRYFWIDAWSRFIKTGCLVRTSRSI